MNKEYVLEQLDIMLDEIKELVDQADVIKTDKNPDHVNLLHTQLADLRLSVKRVIKDINTES